MQSNRFLTQLLLLSAVLALLVLGYLFDTGLNALAPSAEMDMNITRVLIWLAPLFQLLLVLAALFLFWLIYTNGEYSQWVCYTAIVIGLLLLYTPSLLFVLPLPDSLYILTETLAPGTFMFQASALVAGIGFVTLGFWKPDVKLETTEAADTD